MIAMLDTCPATATYKKSVEEAVALVPRAQAPFEAKRWDDVLVVLHSANRAALRDAQALLDQANASTDKEETELLREEAEDVSKAAHIIGCGVLALDLCDVPAPARLND
jgi:hypothetical protein